MKKSFIAIITIISLFSFNANAGSIAVLDVEKIVQESSAMRYIQKKVSEKQKEYQTEIDREQTKLESLQKKLESKKSILSESAFEKEAKKFEEEVNQLKDNVNKKQVTLKEASIDGMKIVNDEIKDIIANLSEEKNIDLIVPAGQTLFYKDALDISEEVLKRLNNKITKVNVTFK